MFRFRISQLLLSVVFLILASYAAYTLNVGNVSFRTIGLVYLGLLRWT